MRAMLVLGMRALHVVLGFGRMGVVGPWTTRGKASMASYLGVMMGLLAVSIILGYNLSLACSVADENPCVS